MTKEQAKAAGYTHKGLIYEIIPIYLSHNGYDETNVKGINLFLECVLWIVTELDMLFDISKYGFKIWEGDEL